MRTTRFFWSMDGNTRVAMIRNTLEEIPGSESLKLALSYSTPTHACSMGIRSIVGFSSINCWWLQTKSYDCRIIAISLRGHSPCLQTLSHVNPETNAHGRCALQTAVAFCTSRHGGAIWRFGRLLVLRMPVGWQVPERLMNDILSENHRVVVNPSKYQKHWAWFILCIFLLEAQKAPVPIIEILRFHRFHQLYIPLFSDHRASILIPLRGSQHFAGSDAAACFLHQSVK